jgi:hypothetical protein
MTHWTPPPGTKIVMPSLLVTNAKFKPSRGSDVQETWRKQGWVPPSASLPPPPPEKVIEPLRRVR